MLFPFKVAPVQFRTLDVGDELTDTSAEVWSRHRKSVVIDAKVTRSCSRIRNLCERLIRLRAKADDLAGLPLRPLTPTAPAGASDMSPPA